MLQGICANVAWASRAGDGGDTPGRRGSETKVGWGRWGRWEEGRGGHAEAEEEEEELKLACLCMREGDSGSEC